MYLISSGILSNVYEPNILKITKIYSVNFRTSLVPTVHQSVQLCEKLYKV